MPPRSVTRSPFLQSPSKLHHRQPRSHQFLIRHIITYNMQRALSSIVRRSLLQRTARSAASPAALLIKASTSSSIQAYRQFSVSTLRFQDGESVFSGSALGGENAASDRPARGQRPDAKLGLFVGGLDPNTRDEDLIRAFSHFGEVTEANVVMDRDTQRSKRCVHQSPSFAFLQSGLLHRC